MAESDPIATAPPQPSEPPTPPPAAAVDQEVPKDAPGATTSVSMAQVHADNVNTADAQYIADRQVFTQYFVGGDRTATLRPLAATDGWQVAREREEEIARLFVSPDGLVDDLLAQLRRRRVLVISGEAGTGRTTFAVHLAARLAAAGEVRQPTWIVPALDRTVRVDIKALARHRGEAEGRVVVFADALERKHPDIGGWFQAADAMAWDELGRELGRQGAFLVFTSTVRAVTAWHQQLTDAEILREIALPSDSLCASGFDKRLEWIGTRHPDRRDAIDQLRANRSTVLHEFRTLPSMARFLDAYVRQADAGIGVDDAIRRFKATAHVFLRSLAADPEAWTATVALALSEGVSAERGAPWVHFERLRRLIWRALRPTGAKGLEEAAGDEPLYARNADDVHLDASRAEIVRAPADAADMVRFRDAGHAGELWEALLRHHRRTLFALVPPLQALASDRNEDDQALCRTATRILGRIGEIDPERLVQPLIDRWTTSADVSDRPRVGALYEGILSSADARYREVCIRSLDALWRDAPDGSDERQRDRTLTALAAYAKLGVHDLPLAMHSLGAIANERVAPLMKDAQRLARLMREAESKIRSQSSGSSAGLVVYHDLLQELTARLYNQQIRTLTGLHFALTSLCLEREPVEVFRHLRKWIASGGPTTGVLVALLFLNKGGLADLLQSVRVEVGARGGQPLTSNPIVLAIAASEDATRQLAEFVADLHESVTTVFNLPTDSLRHFRASLLDRLQGWVTDAVQDPAHADAMARFLSRLAVIHDGRLSELVSQLLSGHAFAVEPDLQAFAVSVRVRQLE